MTDREKLIELLEHDDCPIFMVFGDNIEGLADYLIANGVTVSPCKVGDTVYALYSRRLYRQRWEYRCENVQIMTQTHLELAKAQNAVEIREKECSKSDMHLLGKLVFTNRKEAERVIANE